MSGENQADTKFCAVCGEAFLLKQGNDILYMSGFLEGCAWNWAICSRDLTYIRVYVRTISETSAKKRNACCA